MTSAESPADWPAAWLDEKLAGLPNSPGCYIMKDRSGEVIYVGKAVNLKSRVRSYFQAATSDTRAFIPLLGRLLGDLETVVVNTEKEALLLENELIKRHKPRFNIKLVDDKNFIVLRLDPRGEWPRLEVVRRIQRDGARYFGPYSSASSIRETLRIINRYFRLRTCTDHVLHSRKRPCLLYQMGRCPAPCVHPVQAQDYQRSVEEVVLFLEGRGGELVQALTARMKGASDAQRYEDAARSRDQLFAIERSLERQRVAIPEYRDMDVDVFGAFREADRLVIYVLYVRRGRIGGGQPFFFSGQEFPTEELLESFINLYYDSGNVLPREVLVPCVPDSGVDGLAELLTERKGERVRVRLPRRGEKHELLELAVRNAEQALADRKRSRDETEVLLTRLKERLHLRRIPHRMECFDISHFQGASIVASQVASVDGEADRSRYRRFRIKSVTQQDDFASMYEVMKRRLARGLKESDLPDLLVVDGGKGQLMSAHAAMKDLGVEGIDLVGLAKSREVDDLPTQSAEGAAKSPERVFVLGLKDPIVLPQSSPELFMLTRLRDEAHRFAIGYQQKLMRRGNFRSVLEDIPGVGAGRKRALLRKFGSLRRVREASIEDLAGVEGFSAALVERIHGFLHDPKEERGEEDEVRSASLEDAGTDAEPTAPATSVPE